MSHPTELRLECSAGCTNWVETAPSHVAGADHSHSQGGGGAEPLRRHRHIHHAEEAHPGWRSGGGSQPSRDDRFRSAPLLHGRFGCRQRGCIGAAARQVCNPVRGLTSTS